ncbi:hypothetical protein Ndes2437A_g04508 [Nannochloris sp. 'desiccata']
MKIRRPTLSRPSLLSSKSLAIAFIAAISIIASLNLSPDSFSSGLPIYRTANQGFETTTVSSYTNEQGADVIEHDFSSLVDPAEQDGIEQLETELAVEEEERRLDETETEILQEAQENAEQREQINDELATLTTEELHSGDDEEDSNDQVYLEMQEESLKAYKKSSSGTTDNTSDGTDKYHVVVTVSEGMYVQWQARMCYYWYKKIKAQNPDSAMGGFTRLLHSGVEDEYMDEIPTVVVDPLPPEMDDIVNGYVVLNRPYGLLQWVQKYLDTFPEKYVLMSEPDHIFIKPPPLWATPTKAAAFPFFYIEPQSKENSDIIQKFNKKKVPIHKFAPIGNSPVMIHKDQLKPVVEIWSNLSISIKQDEEADAKWGWVQEMFAWSIASTQVEPVVEYELVPELMLQPPWDAQLTAENGKEAYIIHFTYGNDFNEQGVFTPGKIGSWHFDKRDYMEKYPPLNFPMPPKGCTNEAVKKIISCLNEASKNLPGWKKLAYKSTDEVKPYFGDDEEEEEQAENANGTVTNLDDGREQEKEQEEKEVESASKTSSQVQNFPGILNGTWRLVFAVPAPMPVWAYIPVIEDAIIDVTKQTIELRSFLGPATFTFSGTASFISSPENNVYDMNFSFNASEIAIFGKSWKGQREPKQKTYSFFLAEDELAAVNSRATGGKTLMTRHQ